MHPCRMGCLCALIVFIQVVIERHIAAPECEEECCYLCQGNGDDEGNIAGIDSSVLLPTWFSEGCLSNQAL